MTTGWSGDVLYCFADDKVEEVSAKMGDWWLQRLPVVNRDKRLLGVVSRANSSPRNHRHKIEAGKRHPGAYCILLFFAVLAVNKQRQASRFLRKSWATDRWANEITAKRPLFFRCFPLFSEHERLGSRSLKTFGSLLCFLSESWVHRPPRTSRDGS
jgi:hypothetical protein